MGNTLKFAAVAALTAVAAVMVEKKFQVVDKATGLFKSDNKEDGAQASVDLKTPQQA